MLCTNHCVVPSDPYKSNINDVSIHVSYDRDEESPPGNGQEQQQQSSNVDGSTADASEVADSEGSKSVDGLARQEEVSAGQPTRDAMEHPSVELSDQVPAESHTEDTMEQKVVASSDEAPAENVVETQEQLPSSSGPEETQTETQQTEGSAENEDKP